MCPRFFRLVRDGQKFYKTSSIPVAVGHPVVTELFDTEKLSSMICMSDSTRSKISFRLLVSDTLLWVLTSLATGRPGNGDIRPRPRRINYRRTLSTVTKPRRGAIEDAEPQVQKVTVTYSAASGRPSGRPRTQTTGARDVYPADATGAHEGVTLVSTIPGNVWARVSLVGASSLTRRTRT